jgi:hypothetical protein
MLKAGARPTELGYRAECHHDGMAAQRFFEITMFTTADCHKYLQLHWHTRWLFHYMQKQVSPTRTRLEYGMNPVRQRGPYPAQQPLPMNECHSATLSLPVPCQI